MDPVDGIDVQPEHADDVPVLKVADGRERRDERAELVGVRPDGELLAGEDVDEPRGRFFIHCAGLGVAGIVERDAVGGEEDVAALQLHEIEPANVRADALHEGQLLAKQLIAGGAHVGGRRRL